MIALQVGGFQPLTTIDYPGELAAVIFCQGCPWRCSYCQNIDLLARKKSTDYSWGQIVEFLQRRVGLLDAVVFSGGEPTLQRDLALAIEEVAAMGFKVGLHSAGCYPQRLEALLPLIDWIGLDIKALPENYPDLTGVPDSGKRAWESLALLLAQPNIDYEVRVTVDALLAGRDRLKGLVLVLSDAGVEHLVLQNCHLDGVPQSTALLDHWSHHEADSKGRFSTFMVRNG